MKSALNELTEASVSLFKGRMFRQREEQGRQSDRRVIGRSYKKTDKLDYTGLWPALVES